MSILPGDLRVNGYLLMVDPPRSHYHTLMLHAKQLIRSQRRLGRVCEQYVAAHLDYQPKSLEFLHGVLE